MATTGSFRRLRIVLLIAVVVLVAGLVGLYRFGRAGQAPPVKAAPAKNLGDAGLGEVSVASAQFDYVLSDGDRTLFVLRGQSSQSGPDGQTFIRGMEVRLFAQEEVYTVRSTEAFFSPESEDVTLLGEVTVASDSGLKMTTTSLELRQKGRLLRSDEPVQFVYGELAEGEAKQLRAHLEEGLFVLTGDVWIQNLPAAESPFSFAAERVLFDRGRHHLRADGGVKAQTSLGRIEAQRISLFLDDGERFVSFVRALWGVHGWAKAKVPSPAANAPRPATASATASATATATPRPAAQRLDFTGRSLSVVFEPQSRIPSRFELEGSKAKPAKLTTERHAGPAPLEYNFRSRYFVGNFQNGRIAGIDAWGPVVLNQTVPGATAPLRRLGARRGRAFFSAEGELEQTSFEDDVELDDEAVRATAARADLDLRKERVELFGGTAAGDEVELFSSRGDLRSPHVVYTRADGLLHARQGSKTKLAQGVNATLLEGSPLAGDGPIWVEAEEAWLREAPPGFLFRGQVRAWRGDDLILADSLTGNETEQTLEAEGNVRTVGRSVDTGARDGSAAPVEVTADSMRYDRARGRLVYRGSVRSAQGGRALSCRDLTVELTEAGGAESMLCEGDVKISDPPSGTEIAGGTRAFYRIGDQKIDVSGDPVRLTDRDGRTITGKRMLYDLRTGTFRSGAQLSEEAPPPEPEGR